LTESPTIIRQKNLHLGMRPAIMLIFAPRPQDQQAFEPRTFVKQPDPLGNRSAVYANSALTVSLLVGWLRPVKRLVTRCRRAKHPRRNPAPGRHPAKSE